MDSQSKERLPPAESIDFPNGNRASFVKARAKDDAADLIKALEIKKPAAVLLVIGGADKLDPKLNSQVEQLFDDGLALAAADTRALIIDGGTEAGVMALLGKVVAERGHVTQLLGIAPAGKVTFPRSSAEAANSEGVPLDPNHSHFILVEGSEWAAGTEMMFKVAKELAAGVRVVAILVNGGAEAKEEVARCVQNGWPIIVIEGSGRLADELATNVNFISGGDLSVFRLSDPAQNLRQLIVSQAKSALTGAWELFGQYDSKASVLQNSYKRFLIWTLVLGVLGTLFALTQKQLTTLARPYDVIAGFFILSLPVLLVVTVTIFKRFRPDKTKVLVLLWIGGLIVSLGLLGLARQLEVSGLLAYTVKALTYLTLAVPIVVSVLLTATNRFKPRQKWILLRGGAESVKKEIFRYRTQVGDYSRKRIETSPPTPAPASPDVTLAENIATIRRRMSRTDVNTTSLIYVGKLPPKDAVTRNDDGFSFLTADEYIEVRLLDQLNYYSSKTAKLERQLAEFQWSIFIIGALGTFLAAVGAQLWIAATTALVTALSAYVGHLQFDHTLITYSQSATELSIARDWWAALPSEARLENKEMLVDKVEKALESELTGWVQQMENAGADKKK